MPVLISSGPPPPPPPAWVGAMTERGWGAGFSFLFLSEINNPTCHEWNIPEKWKIIVYAGSPLLSLKPIKISGPSQLLPPQPPPPPLPHPPIPRQDLLKVQVSFGGMMSSDVTRGGLTVRDAPPFAGRSGTAGPVPASLSLVGVVVGLVVGGVLMCEGEARRLRIKGDKGRWTILPVTGTSSGRPSLTPPPRPDFA